MKNHTYEKHLEHLQTLTVKEVRTLEKINNLNEAETCREYLESDDKKNINKDTVETMKNSYTSSETEDDECNIEDDGAKTIKKERTGGESEEERLYVCPVEACLFLTEESLTTHLETHHPASDPQQLSFITLR